MAQDGRQRVRVARRRIFARYERVSRVYHLCVRRRERLVREPYGAYPEDVHDHEKAKTAANSRRMRQLEGAVVVLSALALILIGPIRGALGEYPLILFGSALFLFLVPGVLVCQWIMSDRLWGIALVPISFVISIGLFGLLGVPLLMLHLGLDAFMWVFGVVLTVFLTAAMFRAARGGPPAQGDGATPAGSSSRLLWIPFLLLSAALAFVSRAKGPRPYNDIWVYLAYTRAILSTDKVGLY